MRTNLLLALALFSAGVVKGQIQVAPEGQVTLGSSQLGQEKLYTNLNVKAMVELLGHLVRGLRKEIGLLEL